MAKVLALTAAWTVENAYLALQLLLLQKKIIQRTTGNSKVDDLAVFLEHVDFLNTAKGLDTQLLQSSLEFAVVTTNGLGDLLDLTTGST